MAGHPTPLAGLCELLPAIQTLGARWLFAGSLFGASETFASPRRTSARRSHFRRQLRPSKKNSETVSRGKKGYGSQFGILVDGKGRPLSVALGNGSQNERGLVAPALLNLPSRLRRRLHVVLADGGFYSQPLAQRLWQRFQIRWVTPDYRNAVKRHQDRRRQRRLCRRWRVERSIAWLKSYNRIAKRRERIAANYFGFLQLACVLRLLPAFSK